MSYQSEKKFYVYELAYPESMGGATFYVGKGSKRKTWKGWTDRIDEHEKQATQLDRVKRLGRNVEKCQAIQSIWDNGEKVIKRKIFWTDIEHEAYDFESELIEKYGVANLTNKPRGGKPRSDRFVTVGSVRHKPVEGPKKQIKDCSTETQRAGTDVEYLNSEEVASYLRISKRTLLKEVHEGKIKAFRSGKSLRFTRASLEDYMINQEIKPDEELE